MQQDHYDRAADIVRATPIERYEREAFEVQSKPLPLWMRRGQVALNTLAFAGALYIFARFAGSFL